MVVLLLIAFFFQPNVSPLHIEDIEDQAQKLLLEPLHQFIAGKSSPEQVYSVSNIG